MATGTFCIHTVIRVFRLSDINIHVMSHLLCPGRSRWQVHYTQGPLAVCSNETLMVVQSGPNLWRCVGGVRDALVGMWGYPDFRSVPQMAEVQRQTHMVNICSAACSQG